MEPKLRRAPRETPDSLPKREERTDVIPDDVRDTDCPARLPPDSLPPAADGEIG